MGVLFSAFIVSSSSCRLCWLRVGISNASDWASAVAVLIARSAARERSTSASGTRNETSTRELVATASRMMRSLMGG